LGQIWTNPNVGLKLQLKKLKVEVGLKLEPKVGSNMDKPKCWVKNAIKKVES